MRRKNRYADYSLTLVSGSSREEVLIPRLRSCRYMMICDNPFSGHPGVGRQIKREDDEAGELLLDASVRGWPRLGALAKFRT